MSVTFVRRRKLGRGSTRGMSQYLNQVGTPAIQKLHEKVTNTVTGTTVRWGCTARVPQTNGTLCLNSASAIQQVNDKAGFRKHLQEQDRTLVPETVFESDLQTLNNLPCKMVLRPSRHAQGRNLWVVNNLQELFNVVSRHRRVFRNGWYASRLIEKTAEYRVYVVQGKVATIAEKTPSDPSAVAWNVHQGGRFDVLRWGLWDMEVCRVAVEAFNLSNLDFGGVDVMVDHEGRAYVIEINSAPSLPSLSDGSISYRQKSMAKCFKFIHDTQNKERMSIVSYNGWRDVIHPAVWDEGAT